MIKNLKPNLVAELRHLYQTNGVARRLLDNFAKRQYDRKETPAAHAAFLVGAEYSEIIAVFRQLDELGAGELKVGRRGSKTRMAWNYSIRSLGAAAQGAATALEEIDPSKLDEEAEEEDAIEADGDTSDVTWITHSFQLRPDLRITIKLPADLTGRETDRLSGFVGNLSFED